MQFKVRIDSWIKVFQTNINCILVTSGGIRTWDIVFGNLDR